MISEDSHTESAVDASADGADRPDSDDGPGSPSIDARVFRVIGEQLLARPDPERVDAVASWVTEWRANAETLSPEIDAALKRIEDGAGADIEVLRTAYTHLFRGIDERAPDPPYESLYADGSFYSETTTEIRQGYRWVGLDVDDALGNEPPDHLGLELQFLGELIVMDASDHDSDGSDYEDAQWWILDDHLTEWLPGYRTRLQQEDPHDYYAGLLDLALAVVTSHHRCLRQDR